MNSSTIVRAVLTTIFLLLTFAHAGAAQSKIYKTVDEHGNVVFTDIPPREDESAEQIIVETPNSFAVEEALGPRDQWVVESDTAADETQEPAFSYKSLEIKSPQDDEAIRENMGNVTVVGVASPRLQRGHSIRLLMDGQPLQEGKQSQFALEEVDRGTHSLALEIIDDRGQVLIRSDDSIFHLQRYRIPTPRPG